MENRQSFLEIGTCLTQTVILCSKLYWHCLKTCETVTIYQLSVLNFIVTHPLKFCSFQFFSWKMNRFAHRHSKKGSSEDMDMRLNLWTWLWYLTEWGFPHVQLCVYVWLNLSLLSQLDSKDTKVPSTRCILWIHKGPIYKMHLMKADKPMKYNNSSHQTFVSSRKPEKHSYCNIFCQTSCYDHKWAWNSHDFWRHSKFILVLKFSIDLKAYLLSFYLAKL